MDLLLNEEQVLLRDAAAKARRVEGRAAARARHCATPGPKSMPAAWDEMVKAGWLSALVAEKDDGLGLGMFDLALALEETGKQIVMTPLVEAASAIWAVTKRPIGRTPRASRIAIEDRRAGDQRARAALRRMPPGPTLRSESLDAVGRGVVRAVRRVGRPIPGRCECGRRRPCCASCRAMPRGLASRPRRMSTVRRRAR